MTPRAAYEALLGAGELRPDAAQETVADRLDLLARELAGHDCGTPGKGLLSRLFGSRDAPAPEGVYIHGGVGRGKSMLMDLFFAHTPEMPKRRVHFHEFMLGTHGRLDRLRKGGAPDPVAAAADEIAGEACLLCFDEFHVNDIADAMILGRLFEALLARRVAIVATSNRAPAGLYKDGLNRHRFEPFIALIERRLDILALDGATDYRLGRLRGMETWLTPVDADTTAKLRQDFFRLTDRDVEDAASVPSDEIAVGGRKIFVPKACKGVAVFSFKRLCGSPLGAADYLAVARRYHTMILVAVPRMGREMRNEASRFTTLVDILYEQGTKLVCSAAAPPGEIYVEGDGSFEFARTVSRLAEMASEDYFRRGHCV